MCKDKLSTFQWHWARLHMLKQEIEPRCLEDPTVFKFGLARNPASQEVLPCCFADKGPLFWRWGAALADFGGLIDAALGCLPCIP